MEPQLIAISGSLKGTTFALANAEVSIGREASNTIALNEPSVSRRHCVIKQQPDPNSAQEKQFTVVDLESYNGTFVNSLPVTEQLLAHGDQIALGDVQFLFLTRESESTLPVAQLDEDDLITRSTLKLRGEDALYLRPERVSAELPSNSRVAQDLNTLVTLSSVINSIRDRKTLQHRLLELIPEAFPVERAAILLVDEGAGLLDLAQGWNRLKGFDDSVRVSQTVTSQVLHERVALLSNDIFENEVIGGAPSLVASRVCSLLCVPMIAFEKPLGVIYLDTSDTAARFDEGHLQLLTAIAGIAAIALQNASQFEWLEGENTRLQQEVRLQHEMVGDSPRMSDVYSFLAKVAAGESTVLLRGESGTGKELAAHAIHLNSPRSAKPFVAINCATLTETLLESELFGHEKGAFTGAIAQKRGKLEIADGGTVFLDEVGELTPLIQAKLLRVLQEREFERVGSTRPVKVDVRIIAATNKDLEQAIKAGSFRQDLYYRLNVVSIAMPPLRERRADIPLLANYFVANYSRKCKRKVMGISPDARRLLQNYDWPGNVRELENAIERAVVLGATALIEPDDLPEVLFESGQAAAQPTKYYEAINESKKQIIMKTLKETGGSYTEAAKLLGIHPNNLHRIIRSLNLKSTIQ